MLGLPPMHLYAKQHSKISMPSGVNPVSTTYVQDLWFRNKEPSNQQLQVSDEPKRGRGRLKDLEETMLHCEQLKLFSLYFYISVSLLYVVVCFTLRLKRNVC